MLDSLPFDVIFLLFQHRHELAHSVGKLGIRSLPLTLILEGHVSVGRLQIWNTLSFFLDLLDNLDESIRVAKGVTIDVWAGQLEEGILSLEQLESRIADTSLLDLIQKSAELAPAILSGVKPINRFFPIAEVVEANRSHIKLRKIELLPRLLHLADRSQKLRLTFRR